MKPIFYGIVVLGALLIYEAVKGLGTAHATSSTSSVGSANLPTSTAGLLNPDSLSALLGKYGLPSGFLGIINRESGGVPTATCFAPGSNANACTPNPKPGDTQGAFGLFQFLNSTWNGLGCTPAAPSNPLGVNYAAYNPEYAAACAQKSYQSSGFSAWGG